MKEVQQVEECLGQIGGEPETLRLRACSVMNVLDLIKATLGCGLSAFLIYSYPTLGQIVIIAALSVLWLSYAYRTLANLRRRQ